MSQRSYTPPRRHEAFSEWGNVCRGKKNYPSKRHARGVARAWRESGRFVDGAIVEPYHCRVCRKWHLGGVRNHGRLQGGRDEWMAVTLEMVVGQVLLGLVQRVQGAPRLQMAKVTRPQPMTLAQAFVSGQFGQMSGMEWL